MRKRFDAFKRNLFHLKTQLEVKSSDLRAETRGRRPCADSLPVQTKLSARFIEQLSALKVVQTSDQSMDSILKSIQSDPHMF